MTDKEITAFKSNQSKAICAQVNEAEVRNRINIERQHDADDSVSFLESMVGKAGKNKIDYDNNRGDSFQTIQRAPILTGNIPKSNPMNIRRFRVSDLPAQCCQELVTLPWDLYKLSKK
jgi:hypothetical protein